MAKLYTVLHPCQFAEKKTKQKRIFPPGSTVDADEFGVLHSKGGVKTVSDIDIKVYGSMLKPQAAASPKGGK